ncbi:MAG: serine/threonine-protein kinase [Myxococcota bacterium]
MNNKSIDSSFSPIAKGGKYQIRLGPYIILKKLDGPEAWSSIGTTYKAMQEDTGRIVVIRMLRKALILTSSPEEDVLAFSQIYDLCRERALSTKSSGELSDKDLNSLRHVCDLCRDFVSSPFPGMHREISGEDSRTLFRAYALCKWWRAEILEESAGFKYLDRLLLDYYTHRDHSLSQEFNLRFLRQALILAKLNHPNIRMMYDYRSTSALKTPYMVMEYVPGENLSEWLRKENRSKKDILSIFIQIAEALHYLHDAGFIHRAIDENGILVNEKHEVKIITLDSAQRIDILKNRAIKIVESKNVESTEPLVPKEDPWDLTNPGPMRDLYYYYPRYHIPPEVMEGAPEDIRTDCYSFVSMLYRAFTGDYPFQARDVNSFLAEKKSGAPSFSAGWKRVPNHLKQVILRGLSSDLQDRYRDMDDILSDLRVAQFFYADEIFTPMRGKIVRYVLSALFGTVVWIIFETNLLGILLTSIAAFAVLGLLTACFTFFSIGWRGPEKQEWSRYEYEKAVELAARSIGLGGVVSVLIILI